MTTPSEYDPPPADAPRAGRPGLVARYAVLAGTLALLSLIAWLLVASAKSTSGRPSHGSTISSPTAAYPR